MNGTKTLNSFRGRSMIFNTKEIFVCDFLANVNSEEAKRLNGSVNEYDNTVHGVHVIEYHTVANLRKKPTPNEFLEYFGESFIVVIHESRLLRYARPTIEALLHIASSILVTDKQTGQFSAARPMTDNLNHKIPVDFLNIFLIEDENVVFSFN